MALYCLHLRRSISIPTTVALRHLSSTTSAIPPPPSLPNHSIGPTQNTLQHLLQRSSIIQSRAFKSSSTTWFSSRMDRQSSFDDDKLDPEAILFEGCDYKHWLITMEFPKSPAPCPEEMVEAYVQTCAKVVGSVEEAKKRIYACSTTTYQGFNVEVSEEMSEKFKGLPGVVFVLPDSYIDPVNKEYGGDKYINGEIIPRPPPVQFGRQTGRYGDRNRDFNRPSRPRNYPPPQQNHGPPVPGGRRDPMQMSDAPGAQESYQGVPPYLERNAGHGGQRSTNVDPRNFGLQQNSPPPNNDGPPMPRSDAPGGRGNYQENYNQGGTQNSYFQGQRDSPQGDWRNHAPPSQGGYRADNRNFAGPQGGGFVEGASTTYGQGMGGTYGQGVGETSGHGMGGPYGQGAGGTDGQGDFGSYGQGISGGHKQGQGFGYSGQGEDQRNGMQWGQKKAA